MPQIRRLDSLIFATWNAESLCPRLQEFQLFLQDCNVDVCLVTETHLKPGVRANIANYTCHRTDRLTAGGGTAIYVRNSIRHYPAPSLALRTIETTSVAIETSQGTITFVAAYRQPKGTLPADDAFALFRPRGKCIIAGDLNSKHALWNAVTTNPSGRVLLRAVDRHQVRVSAPDEPTHYPRNGNQPDVLDMCFTQRIPGFINNEVMHALSSDHLPVVFTFDGCPIAAPGRLSTARTDWGTYRRHLHRILIERPPPPAASTDDALQHFVDAIREAVFAATPHQRAPGANRHGVVVPPEILQLIREKNRLAKDWRLTRQRDIKARVNLLQRQIKAALTAHRNRRWDDRLTALTADASGWDLVRYFTRGKFRMPPLNTPAGTVYTPVDKANALADVFERNFTPMQDPMDPDHIQLVEDRLQVFLAASQDEWHPPLERIHEADVRRIFAHLPRRKAPGHDFVTAPMLRELPPAAITTITQLFNDILIQKTFPATWKQAIVVAVPKPGKNRTDPSSYRPISLLSTLSKAFERLILPRLLEHLTEGMVIPNEQFGFRQGHSTPLQLLRVVEEATTAFNNRETCGLILLDASRAFDSVWHRGLVYKLFTAGLPTPLVILLADYLLGRTFVVRVDDTLSTRRPVEAGVPQGSVLGPVLYSLYTADFPTSPRVSKYIYADDVALLNRHRNPIIIRRRLQAACHAVESWAAKWRIKFNAGKSQALLLTRRRRVNVGDVTLFGTPIPWTSHARYLGVTLDRQLTWKKHVDATWKRASAALGALYPLLNQQSTLSVECGLRIYRASIRSIIDYAAPVWGLAARSYLERLQRLQNKALRRVFHVPWNFPARYLHEAAGEPLVLERFKTYARKLYSKARSSDNVLIRRLGQPNDDRDRYKRPVALLN